MGLRFLNEARPLAANVRAAQVTRPMRPRCMASHCAWRTGDWLAEGASAVPALGYGVPDHFASQPLHEAASGVTGFH